MQENRTLFNLHLILRIRTRTRRRRRRSSRALRPRTILLVLLCHNLNLNPVHAPHKFRLKDRFALLLATFVAWARVRAVDACCDGDAVDFEGSVAVDGDEEAVEPAC